MATSSQAFLLPSRRLEAGARPRALGRVYAVLRRLGSSIVQARSRRAEAIVANYIESRGARLTDDLERQVERRFGSTLGS